MITLMKKAMSSDDVLLDRIEELMAPCVDDKSRAAVISGLVREKEETVRVRLTSEAGVLKHLHETDGYHVVRGMWALAFGLAISCSTCLGYNEIVKKPLIVPACIPVNNISDAGSH